MDLVAHITNYAARQNSIALLGQRRQLLRALLLHDKHVDAVSNPALALALKDRRNQPDYHEYHASLPGGPFPAQILR